MTEKKEKTTQKQKICYFSYKINETVYGIQPYTV